MSFESSIRNRVRGITSKAKQGVNDAKDAVVGKANEVKDAVVGKTGEVKAAFVDTTKDAFEVVEHNPVTEAFKKSISDPKGFVTEGVNGAGKVTQKALSSAKETVLKPIDGVIDQATAPLESALTDEIKKHPFKHLA